MVKKIIHKKKLKVVLLIAGFLVIGCHFTQQSLPADAGSSCASGPQALSAAEFNSWFESGAVSLNGAVKPANSVAFTDVPNCSFYKWSEQMFLWLTSPAPPRYGSNGLVMNSSAFLDVSLPDASGTRHYVPHQPGLLRTFNLRAAQLGSLDLPIIEERRSLRFLQVLPSVISPAGRQLVLDNDGKEVEIANARFDNNNRPVLLDVNGKQIIGPRAIVQSSKDTVTSPTQKRLRILDNFDKTSLVEKIMIGKTEIFLDLLGNFPEAEQGQADGGVLMAQNGSLVYYAITVNNVTALFRTMLGSTVSASTRFPISQTELDNISVFAAAHGKTPILDSEALAVELKSSWVEAAGLPDADKFIKMNAVVPTYDKTDPNNWVPNGTKTVELAMVGMHIVGSTGSINPANSSHGHPEMLWATFEQVSNDPTAAYSYTNATGVSTTIPQNTAGQWVFCADGATAPFNEKHMELNGDHIVAVTIPTVHTISPSNIIRAMPWGLPGATPTGNAEVISINNSVRSSLDPADIRRNYIQTGTTWTIFGGFPNGSNQVGTNHLTNTTMETFQQGGNCFNCHSPNTSPSIVNTSISHIFNSTEPLF